MLRRREHANSAVVDDVTRTGQRLRLPAGHDNALEVFYHPFVCAKIAA